jgi:hypothetical protein
VDFETKITGGRPCEPSAHLKLQLLLVSLHGLIDLCLHGIEVKARALLHRRELNSSLGQICHLLLDKHKAPELVQEPLIEVALRPLQGSVLWIA